MKKKSFLRKLGNFLTGQLLIVALLLILQVGLLTLLFVRFADFFPWFYLVCLVLSLLVCATLINKDTEPEFKLSLVVPILLFPLFGGLIFLLFQRHAMGPGSRKRWRAVHAAEAEPSCPLPEDAGSLCKTVRYLEQAGFSLCRNGGSQYFPVGEDMWTDMLQQLERAEKYIFLEYFIIEEGEMWDKVLSVLKRKAALGLDVRVIYDGIGCVTTLPGRYDRRLEQMGIRCKVFNPFIPVLTIRHNNRDHRKILSIDGRVAYTGGINMADEYINRITRFGHWKDGGVRLEGESAWQLTHSFLTMWQVLTGEQEPIHSFRPEPAGTSDDGWAMVHSSEPLGDPVARDLYLSLISEARHSIHLYTPYFVPDQAILKALFLAARSGLDVRVITPRIGDKWYVHRVTRYHYSQLVENGIRIFEYTPGFVHTKGLVCDGETALISSANLDFRSFFHQFEIGVLLHRSAAVTQLEQDFLETQAASTEITEEMTQSRRFRSTLLKALLKLIEPLM